ncbi:hypothetical protein [Nocardia harenae]|uniref:hypothetical protein n=1 Tax=Nocardia harenae TaxID=358707 RepID=UPI000AD8FA02|nr:hypothetical protein [Nocardia harenae]
MTEHSDVAGEAKPAASTLARDQLLYAIGREAVSAAEEEPGDASTALVELARAYAFTTQARIGNPLRSEVRESSSDFDRERLAERTHTLTLEYIDGRPVLRASEGGDVPATLEVLDAAGQPLSRFVAGTDIGFSEDGSDEPPVLWQLPAPLASGGYPQDDGSMVFPLLVNRFEALDFDILPKDDPMDYLDVDVDSFMLGKAAEIEPSPATVARDQLLSAIAEEATRVAESQPGNAAAALAELSRAYALTGKVVLVGGSSRIPTSYEPRLAARSASNAGAQKVGLCLELEP